MWATVSLGLLAGCGEDRGPNGSGGADDPTGTSGQETAPGDDEDDPSGAGTTGSGDPPEPGETDNDSASTGSELGCDLDCGDKGVCVEHDDGSFACECDDGAVSIGLGCVPCLAVEGQVDANVPKIDVVVEVLINEAEPPHSPLETGDLYLRNSTTGDEVHLGQTQDGTLTRTIVPGTYEVYYEHVEGGTLVPVNRRALLDVRYFDNVEPITIDIPMMQISGDITVNEENPPDSAVDWGRVALVDADTGDRAPIGSTSNGGFVANVLPGSYDVRYEARESALTMPVNKDAYLRTVQISPNHDLRQEFDLDIPVFGVDGDITINGAAPPNSPVERGRIVYVDARTGEQIEVGLTSDREYEARLVAGEYDVFYQRLNGGNLVPLNTWGWVGTFVVDSGAPLHVDLKTAHLDGEFRVGGAPPPQDASDDGVFVLRDERGDEVVLGNTAQQTFSAHVMNGSYTVYYAQQTAGALLPANTNARIDSLKVSGDAFPLLNVPVATITGELALSGALPPDSVYDDGRVYLRNRDTGDSALLGNTRLGSYTATVVPGTYDIVYEAEIADQFMPVNKAALIREKVDIADGEVLPVNIPVAQVMGQMLINDGPVTAAGGEIANLYLEDVATGDLIWLGSAAAPAYNRPLATGRYLLRYQAQDAGERLPGNKDATVACIDLSARD